MAARHIQLSLHDFQKKKKHPGYIHFKKHSLPPILFIPKPMPSIPIPQNKRESFM